MISYLCFFFFSSRRRHTRCGRDWSSDVCSSDLNEDQSVEVEMTLTSPNCPVAESLPKEVEDAIMTVPGIKSAKVNIVFDPPWDQTMMSEEAKLELGFL